MRQYFTPQELTDHFTLLPQERTGLRFTNQLSYERSLTNQNLLNGAGVCAGCAGGNGGGRPTSAA